MLKVTDQKGVSSTFPQHWPLERCRIASLPLPSWKQADSPGSTRERSCVLAPQPASVRPHSGSDPLAAALSHSMEGEVMRGPPGWRQLTGLTLNTNISPRKRATVLKLPSQMLGLAPGVDGLSPRGGRGGLGWRSCFLSLGEWILRTGSVGRGLVGSRGSAGGP